MLSSRIPPGEPSTVGLGPPAMLSCMVLYKWESHHFIVTASTCVNVPVRVPAYVCVHTRIYLHT